MTVITTVPTSTWSAAYGPFTRPVLLQVRKGWITLSTQDSAPSDVTDGLRLYQADQVGPVEFNFVDGSAVTSFEFRVCDPGNTGAEVWYEQVPAAST